MKIIKTMCARDCPDACWLDVKVDNNEVIKVEASSENPFTNNITCPRAAADPKRVSSRSRVLFPYIKNQSSETGFNRVDWPYAMKTLTKKLNETLMKHGRESVLLLDYAGNTGYITIGYSKRLWNALGVTMTDYTICSSSGHAAINLHYGLSYGSPPMDLKTKKNIIFWGFNAKTSSPHQWALSMNARRENDANIIVVDPRESESAESADLWISPRPCSDVALAYGIANYLITNNSVDLNFIKKYTFGYEAYKQEALHWTPDMVKKVTGVNWNQIENLCFMLRESPSVFMIGIGLNKSLSGAESCRAVSLIPALLGQHRGFYYTNSRGLKITGDIYGSTLTNRPPKIVSMVSLGERLAAGEFKFVYIVGMNPVLTLPDSNKIIDGLKREDCFVVVHETHFSETTKIADLILPAPTYLEKDDFYISDCHPFVRIGRKAIEPMGESRDEHSLMLELAKRLNEKEAWVHIDPWADLEKNLKDAFINGDFNVLFEGKSLRVSYKPMDEYQTKTGKIEFTSTSTPPGISSLPEQIELKRIEDEFIMLNSSLPLYTHTQFREVYGNIPCNVWVNKFDAEKLGLIDGRKYKMYNKLGEVIVSVKVSKKILPGVVWCPRELVDENGSPQNSLTPGIPQNIGGGPIFNSVIVKFKEC